MAPWAKAPEGVSGVWLAYRHTHPSYPPLWYAATSGVDQESGRWHQRRSGVAQYLALSPNGAWAERCRQASIRDDDRRREETRSLWQLQVVEQKIADLSTFDRYTACGLAPELAIGGHDGSRQLAAALINGGYRGVLSPSAAYDHPEAVNLTLFGERLEALVLGEMPHPTANKRPELFVASARIADEAAPTHDAMQRTCYLGVHHRQFTDWCAGSGHTPDTALLAR